MSLEQAHEMRKDNASIALQEQVGSSPCSLSGLKDPHTEPLASGSLLSTPPISPTHLLMNTMKIGYWKKRAPRDYLINLKIDALEFDENLKLKN